MPVVLRHHFDRVDGVLACGAAAANACRRDWRDRIDTGERQHVTPCSVERNPRTHCFGISAASCDDRSLRITPNNAHNARRPVKRGGHEPRRLVVD